MEVSAIPDLFIGLDGAYDILRHLTEETLTAGPGEEWLKISSHTYIGILPMRRDLSFYLFVGLEAELLQDAQAFLPVGQRPFLLIEAIQKV